MDAPIYNQTGKETGKFRLPVGIFDMPWNADLVHEVVRLMNSNSRSNVAHAKTRGEVRGGGKKPWQQKGTGRARHGSRRSPIWVGGGTTHGPRNEKNFDRKINKKVRTKALFTVLSQKFRDGQVLFLDNMDIAIPKAKDARGILSALSGIKGFEKLSTKKVNAAVIALDRKAVSVEKSFNNFGNVAVEEFRNINPVSILNHTYLIIANPAESLKALSEKVTTPSSAPVEAEAPVKKEKVAKAKVAKVPKVAKAKAVSKKVK